MDEMVVAQELSALPSEAVMQMWLAVADTYEARQLKPMWAHVLSSLYAYSEDVGFPQYLVRSVWAAVAYGMYFDGDEPPCPEHAPGLAQEYERVAHGARSWLVLQDLVLSVSRAWREVGR